MIDCTGWVRPKIDTYIPDPPKGLNAVNKWDVVGGGGDADGSDAVTGGTQRVSTPWQAFFHVRRGLRLELQVDLVQRHLLWVFHKIVRLLHPSNRNHPSFFVSGKQARRLAP